MPDYQKMYTTLFNQITDTIQDLQRIQQQAEELYISENPNTSNEPIQTQREQACKATDSSK